MPLDGGLEVFIGAVIGYLKKNAWPAEANSLRPASPRAAG